MKTQFEEEDIRKIAAEIINLILPHIKALSPASDDPIFDVDSLATYLSVKKSWVYQHKYKLPHFKVGLYVRFRKSAIDEYLKKTA